MRISRIRSPCCPSGMFLIDEILAGLYFQFDMKLNIKGVQKDY
jgi:hypothetical protein